MHGIIDLKNELKRKAFHLLGFIYPLFFTVLSRERFFQCLVVWIFAIVFFEVLRLKTNCLNNILSRWGESLFRQKEKNMFSGMFWMAFGILICTVLVEIPKVFLTICFYLLIGDSVASLGGKYLKGLFWPNSQKRVSGSLVCFICCLLIGGMFLHGVMPWWFIILGAFSATVFEFGFMSIDDNFLIPVGCSVVLTIAAVWGGL